ncbi:MAG TPA: hypothetical protein VJ653_08930 [Acidimicrobiales bacterium]|nr:hypothetical protein [Acidimicrobiales bacterium]
MSDNTTVWKTGYMPLIVGGIGAMASALFMPWLTVVSPTIGEVTRIGVQLRDGRIFALALFVLAMIARSEARSPRATTRTALLTGFVVLAAALAIEQRDLSRLVDAFQADFAHARLGFGIYAMGIGLAASLTGVVKRRQLAARVIEQQVTESSPSSPL